MSRTRTPIIKPARLARELAALAAELAGPPELAALAVFGRFLFPQQDELAERVAALPDVARERWMDALDLLGDVVIGRVEELVRLIDRDALWSRIDREASPVLPEGRLFELFLHAVDRQQGRRRGVYYTPLPLVNFLLRSVRQVLVDQFDGASQINLIDPACGYGAFLLAAANQLPAQRTTGCEICPITWAAAHVLLASESNTNINLLQCNPLEQGEALRETLLGPAEAPLLPVIVGNPPWSNFGRQNRSPWIARLLADYRTGLAERKSNLADDSIKFLRWGQYWIGQAGRGILAFVTPNTWLDGLTHRRMRESLLATFDDVSIVDLHGDVDEDENVFGVRSGAAVVMLLKRGARLGSSMNVPGSGTPYSVLSTQYLVPSTISRIDLVGTRASKLDSLEQLNQAAATPLHPHSPDWSLALPRTTRSKDYASFWPLDRIFRHYISGVQTKNDAVFVGFTREELAGQVQAWLAEQPSPVEFDPACIRPYLVAPFDRRWVYYDPRLIGRARYEVLRHMLQPNLGLVFMRQSTAAGEYNHFLAVDSLVSDRVFYSRRGAPFVAPLWVGSRGSGVGDRESEVGDCSSYFRTEYSVLSTQYCSPDSNFDPLFLDAMASVDSSPTMPEEAFHYLYAVCHAPTYRQRYDAELRRDFPRLPLPANFESFRQFAEFGRALVDLHLMKVTGGGPGPGLVPAALREGSLRIGGYEVVRRWRAQRKGREETEADRRYVEELEFVAEETARLAREIDRVYVETFPSPT